MNFSAFQVPPSFVPLVRSMLQQQGMNPAVVGADGSVSASDLMGLFFDTVEMRTAYSPPVRFKVAEPPDPRTQELLKQVRPALVLSGRAGRVEIAPFGVPSSPAIESLKQGITAGVLGLVGAWMLKKAFWR